MAPNVILFLNPSIRKQHWGHLRTGTQLSGLLYTGGCWCHSHSSVPLPDPLKFWWLQTSGYMKLAKVWHGIQLSFVCLTFLLFRPKQTGLDFFFCNKLAVYTLQNECQTYPGIFFCDFFFRKTNCQTSQDWFSTPPTNLKGGWRGMCILLWNFGLSPDFWGRGQWHRKIFILTFQLHKNSKAPYRQKPSSTSEKIEMSNMVGSREKVPRYRPLYTVLLHASKH